MNILKCFNLAWYNVKQKPKFSTKMICCVTFIMVMLSATFLLLQGIQNFYDNQLYGNAKSNSIYYPISVSDNNLTEDSLNVLNKLKNIPHVENPIVCNEIDIPQSSGNEKYSCIGMERAGLSIDGTEFVGTDDKSNNFLLNQKNKVCLQMSFYLEGTNVFSKNDETEFEYYYPNEKLILAGSVMQNAGEVMMSDYVLERFGITDYNDIIGKKISILIDGKPYIEDMLLTGIINSNKYYIESDFIMSPQILMCGTQEQFSELNITYLNVFADIDNYANSIDVYDILEQTGLTDTVEYSKVSAVQYVYMEQVKDLSRYVMIYITGFIAIAMLMSIYSIILSHIKEKSTYYAMLRAIGIKRSTLFAIFSCEQIILVFASLLLTIPVSGLLFSAINYFINDTFEAKVMVTLNTFLKSTLIITAISAFTMLVLANVLLIYNQRKAISILLKK